MCVCVCVCVRYTGISIAVCRSVLQCVAVRCSVLQRLLTVASLFGDKDYTHLCVCVCKMHGEHNLNVLFLIIWQHTAARCNTLQHTATRCDTDYTHMCVRMGWRWLVGSLKLYVSFAKEPDKIDYILQKRPII